MNKYRDWSPTLKHPSLEDQVAFDLLEEMSVPKEVLNRLADKEAGIIDILRHYKFHLQAEYQKQLAKTIAGAATASAGEMLGPIIEKWLENLMLPPPVPIMGVPIRMGIIKNNDKVEELEKMQEQK